MDILLLMILLLVGFAISPRPVVDLRRQGLSRFLHPEPAADRSGSDRNARAERERSRAGQG
jgi:hypothetical protein